MRGWSPIELLLSGIVFLLMSERLARAWAPDDSRLQRNSLRIAFGLSGASALSLMWIKRPPLEVAAGQRLTCVLVFSLLGVVTYVLVSRLTQFQEPPKAELATLLAWAQAFAVGLLWWVTGGIPTLIVLWFACAIATIALHFRLLARVTDWQVSIYVYAMALLVGLSPMAWL